MTQEAFRSLVKAGAAVSVVIGAAGSVLCLPYALSSNLRFVTTTGIYFIAGGVMITGGLIALSLMIQPEK